MSIGLKGNVDGSGAVQVGGSDAITISTGLNTTFAGTVTATGTVAGTTGTLYPIVSGTAVNTTSGSSVDYTNIPSWVKRINFIFSGLSSTTAAEFIIQLGTGATPTFQTSGYSTGAGAATATTTGFLIFNPGTTVNVTGVMTIDLLDAATFKWVESYSGCRSDNTAGVSGAGNVTLSAPLTAIRLTTVGGGGTFDAGTVNVLYE